jgi:hypothetical protein
MTERVSYLRCSAPKCDNPLSGQRTRFCSLKCSKKVSSLRRSEECKGVYAPLDWAGGPRGMVGEGSVKKDESFVGGNDRFSVDDYGVDPEIFAIAEANHEKYIQDRSEHENRVVIDGLQIFQEEFNKHHKVTYAAQQYHKRKNEEEFIIKNKAQQRLYYAKNKEKTNTKAGKVRTERS